MNNTITLTPLLEQAGRRQALKKIGLGAAGLALGFSASQIAEADSSTVYPRLNLSGEDAAILQFALNLEYLEAEFYSYATTGASIQSQGVTVSGRDTQGTVNVPDTTLVTFTDSNVQQYALEIASDEISHVNFLRGVLTASGYHPVAEPSIDLVGSFAAAASAAGLGEGFSPFTSELNFLLGAFIFEDVGVTAYHGAIPVFANNTALASAAGIMGTEAYHAGIIRSTIYGMGSAAISAANAISSARNALGGEGLDQGVSFSGMASLVPADPNAVVFARTTRLVQNIVYLGINAKKGGFFPQGMNS